MLSVSRQEPANGKHFVRQKGGWAIFRPRKPEVFVRQVLTWLGDDGTLVYHGTQELNFHKKTMVMWTSRFLLIFSSDFLEYLKISKLFSRQYSLGLHVQLQQVHQFVYITKYLASVFFQWWLMDHSTNIKVGSSTLK